MANSIMVIFPYLHNGTWVFDDDSKGLDKEPFVEGVPEVLEQLLAAYEIKNADKGFRLIFSANPFPNYQLKVDWVREEFDGNWYKTADGFEGWLCPALFKYFEKAPASIYLKVEEL